MEKIELYKFYMFGWDYRILYSGSNSKNAGDAQRFVEKIIGIIKENQLDVTYQIIQSERQHILSHLDAKKPSDPYDEQDKNELSNFALTLEKTLDAELRLKHAFLLTPKRLDLNKLLDDIGTLFGSGIFSKMSDLAKRDFEEAGKCIAFERPTAAAFHVLRATEETLRQFYHKKIPKKDHISPLLWKPMIDQMRKKPKISKTILDSFDNIRFNFRNPTSHPDTFYSMDEIQDLLLLCIEANSRVTKELNK